MLTHRPFAFARRPFLFPCFYERKRTDARTGTTYLVKVRIVSGSAAATFVRLCAIWRTARVGNIESAVMKYAVVVAGVLSALVLGACERASIFEPAVVVVPVAGPAGPQGEAGKTGTMGPTGMVGSPGMTGTAGMMGAEGEKGEQGKTGQQGTTGGDTTVVVLPAK